jgi:hypothetical protein
MAYSLLSYPPSNGFLHHWLVAGPVAAKTIETHALADEMNGSKTAGLPLAANSPVVDLGPLDADNPEPAWRYYREDDHWVDLSGFYPVRTDLRSWTYAIIDCPAGGPGEISISVQGCSVEVWINGSISQTQDLPTKKTIQTTISPVIFQPGHNEVLVRLQAKGARETPCRLGVQMMGYADQDLKILLPTEIEADLIDLRHALETVIAAASLDRYVFGYLDGDHYHKNEPITLRYSNTLPVGGEVTHRLQSLSGDIFQETTRVCSAGSVFELARTFPLRNGPHHLNVLPPVKEYYQKKLQFERKILFFIARTDFSATPKGTYIERAKQALADAAQRRNLSLFCEIAKMGLGQWDLVGAKALKQAVERIQGRQDGSEQDLLGVVLILLRFKKKNLLPEVRAEFEACLEGYRYWSDQPGDDCMDFNAESRQIIFHICEMLAGQLFPRKIFANSGQTGEWHRRHGETLALTWMKQKSAYGFQEWDSPTSVERILAALSIATDLAASENIREMSSILMDKVFFSLALNSWHGIYGSSRGCADTPEVLSPRLEPTSGICRLMWGMGNFNESVMGGVSLALCQTYELPAPIEKIARDATGAVWTRERSGRPGNDWAVNRVTYKTQDFMLCSAQDYAPGQPGLREHVWQASLGPDAVVFTNHPTNMNDETNHGPNLWAGNGILPRAVQWGDVLMAFYQLPQKDWMGFTHAYFPVSAFDEYQVQENWAFARKGKGYLALFAAGGYQWMQEGKTAMRELRSYGSDNAWICHMGQEVLDGDFASFQQKILALDLTAGRKHVEFINLRGDRLSAGWEGSLQVNGEVQSVADFKHYETPYCSVDLPATGMDIVYAGEGVRLKFS